MLKSKITRDLYQGPNDSKTFNTIIRHIQEDLYTLFGLLNKNEETLTKQMDVLMRENQFLQNRMTQLQQDYEAVGEKKEGEVIDYLNFYQASSVLFPDQYRRPENRSLYGVLLPVSSTYASRFTLGTDEVVIPNELKVYIRECHNVSPKTQDGKRSYEDIGSEEVNGMFDRDKNTFWIRKSVQQEEESIHEVYGEIHIVVPKESNNSLLANELRLAPYPEGSLDIEDILVKGVGESWHRLSTFPTKDGNPVIMENIRKTLFTFPREEITEIRIFVRQRHWFQHENKREFTYGFQDIDLGYSVYSEKESEMVTVFDVSAYHGKFSRIEEPVILWNTGSESNLSHLIRHELYYDESLLSPFEFNKDILAPLDRVYIRTILKRENDNVPVLKGLKLKGTLKEG